MYKRLDLEEAMEQHDEDEDGMAERTKLVSLSLQNWPKLGVRDGIPMKPFGEKICSS